MKIVHLTRRYWPSMGGVETHLLKVNQCLVDHEVKVITEQHDSSLNLIEAHQQVMIYRIKVEASSRRWGYKFSLWRGILKNWSIIRQADVIQIHDVFWWLLPFWLLLGGKSIYMTFHGHEGNTEPSSRQIFWHWLASKLTKGNISVGGFHQKWYRVKPTYVTFGATDIAQ